MTNDLDHFFDEEPLDPELEPYMSEVPGLGKVLQHPLVYSVPHYDALNRHVNGMLHQKRRKLDECVAEEEWSKYVFLHERPYRAQAIDDIRDGIPDELYWELVRHNWIDCENVHQNMKLWLELLNDSRPLRETLMDDDERRALAAMPDPIPIFRGCDARRGARGLSWSTDREVAIRLGHRYSSIRGPTLCLATGVVRKRHVIAYFEQRNELEIVAHPNHVKSLVTTQIPRLARYHGKG